MGGTYSDFITVVAGGQTYSVVTALVQILRNFRPLIRHVVQRVPVEYREDAEDEIYLGLVMSLTAFVPLVLDNNSAYKSRPSSLIDR